MLLLWVFFKCVQYFTLLCFGDLGAARRGCTTTSTYDPELYTIQVKLEYRTILMF